MTGVLRARVGGTWVDVVGGTDEVWVGTDDPIASSPTIELWYDSDDDPAASDAANYWNSAWGIIGSAYGSTSDQNITAPTVTDITGCSVTFQAVAGRRYRTTLTAMLYGTTTNIVHLTVCDASNTLMQQAGAVANAYESYAVQEVYNATSGGTVTRKARVDPGASGTATVTGTFNRFATIVVEDIGPIARAAVNPPAGQPQIATAGNALGIVAMGVAGSVNVVAPVTVATTISPSVTTTFLVGRRYRISQRITAIGGAPTPGTMNFQIFDANNTFIGDADQWTAWTGNYGGTTLTMYMDGDGTTKTIRSVVPVGGFLGITNGTSVSVFYKALIVEDVGPNSAPALPIPDTPPGWTLVSNFVNGWVPYGTGTQVPRYRKIGDIVYLEGSVKSGTLGVAMFTLPLGFRPALARQFAQTSWNTVAGIAVNTDGTVTSTSGGSNLYIGTEAIFSVTA